MIICMAKNIFRSDSALKKRKEKDYLLAVNQWVIFANNGVDKEKAFSVMKKFYFAETIERLESNLTLYSGIFT